MAKKWERRNNGDTGKELLHKMDLLHPVFRSSQHPHVHQRPSPTNYLVVPITISTYPRMHLVYPIPTQEPPRPKPVRKSPVDALQYII